MRAHNAGPPGDTGGGRDGGGKHCARPLFQCSPSSRCSGGCVRPLPSPPAAGSTPGWPAPGTKSAASCTYCARDLAARCRGRRDGWLRPAAAHPPKKLPDVHEAVPHRSLCAGPVGSLAHRSCGGRMSAHPFLFRVTLRQGSRLTLRKGFRLTPHKISGNGVIG